jgi:hypothetical protein
MQDSGNRLNVEEHVEECRAVVNVLHILASFVLVLQFITTQLRSSV